MNHVQKTEIAEKLNTYCTGFESQAKAAASIKDVSEAMVIQMRKGNWSQISDAMWRTVANQIGYQSRSTLVETKVFQTCTSYYTLAKEHGETFALIGYSGCGKTFSADWFSKHTRQNAYHLRCAGYWNKKYFLVEMIEAMGKSFSGNTYEMMKFIISELRKQDKPLFILDEIDKLAEPVLLFFITLYNELHGLCGFVWQSTHAMRIVMEKKAAKIGYSELMTRISAFVELPKLNKKEVADLSASLGMESEEEVNTAIAECDFTNVRRIKRLHIKKLVRNQVSKTA